VGCKLLEDPNAKEATASFRPGDIGASAMVHLTKSGIAGTANIQELARQFAKSCMLRLPQPLHLDLIRKILPLLQSYN
jgi:hypothetical protein